MKVNISKIKENPNNPRTIKDYKFQKLVKSIKEFPEMLSLRPIVVNKDYMILGGNMRLKALKEAGIKEVEIQIADLTEDQQKEFIIKDNLSFGEWDWDLLANEWNTDFLNDWGLDLPYDFNFDNNEMIGEKKEKPFEISITFIDPNELDKCNQRIKEIIKDYECKLKIIGGEC